MVIMVSTRLWLGGAVSPSRDKALISAASGPDLGMRLAGAPIVGGDRWACYLRESVRQGVSLEALHRASRRPALDSLAQSGDRAGGQTLRAATRGVGVERRVKRGSCSQLMRLLDRTQGGGVLNTAYIERLNATFGARLGALVRRTRGLARRHRGLHAGGCTWWVGFTTFAATMPA